MNRVEISKKEVYLSDKLNNEQKENNDDSYNYLKNLKLKNIDDEEEDDNESNEDLLNYEEKQSNFDDKEEFLNDVGFNLNIDNPNKQSDDESIQTRPMFLLDPNDPKLNSDQSEFIRLKSQIDPSLNLGETQKPGKSKFYLQTDNIEHIEEHLESYFENEDLLFTLSNTDCIYSSKQFKSIAISGKLLLTSFRLIFLPYKNQQTDFKSIESEEKNLYLFSLENAYSIVIPLNLIYEIRASTSSDKYRQIKNTLENTPNGVPRDMLIKCKNFMTKSFIFSNHAKNYGDIFRFIKNLLYFSNNQRLINDRFRNLIDKINQERDKLNNQQTELEISKKITNENQLQQRKSYLLGNDLQQDLIDYGCNYYLEVKNGKILSDQFLIDTKMRFCVFPKSINEVIQAKRVVINEANVSEFYTEQNINRGSSAKNSISSSSNSNRKPSRVSELLGSSTPRNSKQINANTSNFQTPILANISYSNPFYDNSFPTWSFTNIFSGCSLIIVPEASSSNRQEECDIIIKNYNAFLCDENIKQNKFQGMQQTIVSFNQYGEYEFYKFQVPFDFNKITLSYLRLMEICSFKTNADYAKENESSSFYVKLHNSKWMKKISSLISLTSKIVNCLHISQRNVFLEEFRSNRDCSCILTSLVKLCMDQKCRTIIGFENLIQKDWFLVGHLFNKRLQTPSNNKEEYANQNVIERKRSSFANNLNTLPTSQQSFDSTNTTSKTNGQISPTFLLFLDCVFQLIIQYPDEFEFNEIYLIHMFDYVCSGISFTFAFDGALEWLEYLRNQTFLTSQNVLIDLNSLYIKSNIQSSTVESVYLKEVFDENNSFWLNHLHKENFDANQSTNEISNSNSKILNRFNKLLINNKYCSNSNLILSPCEKMYVLRFWSRCYLRWNEKYHAYNSINETESIKTISENFFNKSESNSLLNTRKNLDQEKKETKEVLNLTPTRPAPPPPTLAKLTKQTEELLKNKAAQDTNSKIVIASGGLKITTRITPDGNIESSF